MGKWIEKIYRLLPKDISKKKCTQIGDDHCCVVLWTSGVRFLINFRDKIIYASSFLKIFGIAEVLVLDFRKLTESQKLWFQCFEEKNTITRRTSSFGFILRTAGQGSELVLWFSGNPWSRVPCVLINPTH
jgi:hypothetical protein